MKNMKLAVFSILLGASGFAVSATSSAPNSGEVYLSVQQGEPSALGRVLLYKNNLICGSAQQEVTSSQAIDMKYGPGKSYCQTGVDSITVKFGNQNVQYISNKFTPRPGGYCQIELQIYGSNIADYIGTDCYLTPEHH